MYDFIRNMFVMGRITADQVQGFIEKGFITVEQADAIIAEPQV